MNYIDDRSTVGEMAAAMRGSYEQDLAAQATRIAELEDSSENLKVELSDLQDEYDQHQTKVSADFEGDCWGAMRRLLVETGFDSWHDPDGVTAEMAYEHLVDSLRESTKQDTRIAELEDALAIIAKVRVHGTPDRTSAAQVEAIVGIAVAALGGE